MFITITSTSPNKQRRYIFEYYVVIYSLYINLVRSRKLWFFQHESRFLPNFYQGLGFHTLFVYNSCVTLQCTHCYDFNGDHFCDIHITSTVKESHYSTHFLYVTWRLTAAFLLGGRKKKGTNHLVRTPIESVKKSGALVPIV